MAGSFQLELKDRSKVIILDDTLSFKTEEAREDILAEPDTWAVEVDDRKDRHGTFISCRKECVELLKKQEVEMVCNNEYCNSLECVCDPCTCREGTQECLCECCVSEDLKSE